MKEFLTLYKEDLALRKQQMASAGLGMTVDGTEMTMPLRRVLCPGEKRGREDEEGKDGDQMAWKKARTDEETGERAVQQLAEKTGDAGDGTEAKQQTEPYDGSIMIVDNE
ncbi:hypothetical protein KEM56_006362 [Ascosphaera pollenicola]|nr:hypothetical protein KEM56_006362 [Ascosphaera pollenicola]